jgi:hypothetical protein
MPLANSTEYCPTGSVGTLFMVLVGVLLADQNDQLLAARAPV